MNGPPFSVPREEVYRLFDTAFTLEPLFHLDVLEENQKFREKGLSQLTEQAYHLARKPAPDS
jgi:thiopurine S-methyltransferase